MIVMIVARFLYVDHIAVGDETVFEVVDTACFAKRSIEDKGERNILILVHTLVEVLIGVKARNHDGELQIT